MKLIIEGSVFEQPFTGVAKATLGLYRACSKIDDTLHIMSIYRRRLHGALPDENRGIRIFSWLPSRIWRGLAIPISARQYKADVVHYPWNGGIPMMSHRGITVMTLHDVLPLIIPGYLKTEHDRARYCRMRQRDISRAHLVVTVSEYSKTQILEHFTVKHEPVVIYNAPTLRCDSGTLVKTHKEGGEYFIYVGGYDPRKGLESLLKVFISLFQEGKISSRLLLTGTKTNYSDAFRRLVCEGLETGAIDERGYVDDDELCDLLRGARGLLYPSRYEGCGLPPLEAMSIGCPVVAVRSTAIPEICGDAVLYCEPGMDGDLARAIVALDGNEYLRGSLAERGRKRARQFSWEESAAKYLSELSRVLHSHGELVGI